MSIGYPSRSPLIVGFYVTQGAMVCPHLYYHVPTHRRKLDASYQKSITIQFFVKKANKIASAVRSQVKWNCVEGQSKCLSLVHDKINRYSRH